MSSFEAGSAKVKDRELQRVQLGYSDVVGEDLATTMCQPVDDATMEDDGIEMHVDTQYRD
ncbi:hypothetical protein TRIUR3_02051 [Triticum urartu]|uniref:Uncharacterized protein n=1 Tax=Triticum urartu TaxID=4572 RepID=M7ZGU2_TRIUA|nr:hypothetical protein TRIUR3_02051 [Triticum urartu]